MASVRTALGPERDRVSIMPYGSGRFKTCYKPFDTVHLKLGLKSQNVMEMIMGWLLRQETMPLVVVSLGATPVGAFTNQGRGLTTMRSLCRKIM